MVGGGGAGVDSDLPRSADGVDIGVVEADLAGDVQAEDGGYWGLIFSFAARGQRRVNREEAKGLRRNAAA